MQKNPKALVTGASGFIGSTLVEELNRAGYEVRALMRGSSKSTHLQGLSYQRAEGDLSDEESLRRAVTGMDFVFHLAGVVRASSRQAFFQWNSEGSRLLARVISEVNPSIRRLVYVSSIAAVGPAPSLEDPKTEDGEPMPVSAYGESKLQGEREILAFKDRIPVAIARPPIVYGPKDKDVFIMIRTVSRGLMPVPRGLTPDGSKYYSLIHARDLCQGLLRIAEAPPAVVPSGEVFFLCDGEVHSYREMLRTMARCLAVKPVELPVPPFFLKAAAGAMDTLGKITRRTYALNNDKLNEILPDYWICSARKAERLLGFQPRFNLSSGMDDAIRWYKARRWL